MAIPVIGIGSDHEWWVKQAQWHLIRNRFGYNAQPGPIDGEAGGQFGRACKRMKWVLGYPLDDCKPFYGPALHSLLVPRFVRRDDGTLRRNPDYAPIPPRYEARRLARKTRRNPFPEPTPAIPWPFKSRKTGMLNGLPYQGTHTRGNWESDRAVDLNVPYGTPVLAIWDGVIVGGYGPIASSDPALLGQRLHLRRSDGAEAYYAHLSRLTARWGAHVKRGDQLGLSGSANGVNHLHIATNPMRPDDFLQVYHR